MDKIKSLFEFHSKREVAENFSLDELLNFARENNLQEWLAENFYSFEARKVTSAINKKSDDTELKLLLCKIFDMSPENLSADELEKISAAVEKNHRRELFMEKSSDNRKSAFVETQGELVRALNDDAKLIYLCGGEFRIPLDRGEITYIGCENAIVDLDEEDFIDLDAGDIILENLQIYLRHSNGLRAEKSENIKIIDGSKKILGDRPTLKEIFDILRGRKTFESPENFKQRSENIRGAAIGLTLLEEKNYDFDAAQFNFRPQWDFEYISALKNFVIWKNFSVKLAPQDAENLYGNERKLQIFADFTYSGSKLTILNLYFDTKTLGRVAIEITLRVEKISSGSSSVFGLGYGLDIIAAYDVRFKHESISHVAY